MTPRSKWWDGASATCLGPADYAPGETTVFGLGSGVAFTITVFDGAGEALDCITNDGEGCREAELVSSTAG